MTHTPGPWKVFEHTDHSGLEIGPPYEEEYLAGHVQPVCTIRAEKHTYPCECSPRQQSDARLIAAAPTLLEALELVHSSTAVLNHLDREHIDVIERAIRKAKGGR